jgi:hypothetical protein
MPQEPGLVDDHQFREGLGQGSGLMGDGFVGGGGVLEAGLENPGVGPHFERPGQNDRGRVARFHQGKQGVDGKLRERLRSQGRHFGKRIPMHQFEQVDEILGLEGQGALGRHHADLERGRRRDGSARLADLVRAPPSNCALGRSSGGGLSRSAWWARPRGRWTRRTAHRWPRGRAEYFVSPRRGCPEGAAGRCRSLREDRPRCPRRARHSVGP